MGGKDFKGTESFVEARNWLKETEDLFVISRWTIGRRYNWRYGYSRTKLPIGGKSLTPRGRLTHGWISG